MHRGDFSQGTFGLGENKFFFKEAKVNKESIIGTQKGYLYLDVFAPHPSGYFSLFLYAN